MISVESRVFTKNIISLHYLLVCKRDMHPFPWREARKRSGAAVHPNNYFSLPTIYLSYSSARCTRDSENKIQHQMLNSFLLYEQLKRYLIVYSLCRAAFHLSLEFPALKNMKKDAIMYIPYNTTRPEVCLLQVFRFKKLLLIFNTDKW